MILQNSPYIAVEIAVESKLSARKRLRLTFGKRVQSPQLKSKARYDRAIKK